MERLTPEQIRKARAELVAMGLIVDSGMRRNGEIVWVAVPKEKN
jgi:hypothetical protein